VARLIGDYVFSLKAFVAHHDCEFDALAFDQYPVAFASNCPEVDKDIVATVTGNETETL
tara:strand:+ start:317 stop:493 length:177 start_codon:yes stop_codon:yes gene_type:complete